jgi:hypothetical protein
LLAEKILINLETYADTHSACSNAIDTCWTWLSDRDAVLPSDLAYYVDAGETSFGSLDELRFENDSIEKSSLIFIVMVIGYFAHKAYWVAGIPKQMSESVCEANDNLLPEFFKYAALLGYEEGIIELLGREISHP